jgi:hypothetical protein
MKPPPLQIIVGFQIRDARYKVFTVALQTLVYKIVEKGLLTFHSPNIYNEYCREREDTTVRFSTGNEPFK